MIMLVGALIFYVLHLIFKSDELNIMSVIMCVLALAMVVQDTEIGDDLIYFVIPLFYGVVSSALSFWPGYRSGE